MADSSGPSFRQEIQQMMFVSGETAEPSIACLTLIEEIVHSQVVEILSTASSLAARRGSRFVTNNDLFFQFRHDHAKVARLQGFLSWKDVRRSVKDSDEKGEDLEYTAPEEPMTVETGGPVADTAKRMKGTKVRLPWDIASFFGQSVPEGNEGDSDDDEINQASLERLREADQRTKDMTREEYVLWSEYRHASFTWRKVKRFREWAGIGIIAEVKANEDIIDILGFLICEMVQTLTNKALEIKGREDAWKDKTGGNICKTASGKRQLHERGGLFDHETGGKTAVEKVHIYQAFANLQSRPNKARAMLNGTKLPQRTNLKLF